MIRSDALVALVGDLARALVAAAVLVLLWFFSVYYMSLGQQMFAELHMNDFGRFYYSAQAFLNGADMYGPTPATALETPEGTRHLWNMNPPHFHLIVLPLARLSPGLALTGWASLNLAALAWTLYLIARELGLPWTWRRLVWTLVGVMVCSATGIIVVTGQLTFLLMLPVTLAWIDARHGRWRRAAMWLGLTSSVKPFLGIFALYFIVTKRVSALVWMAGVGALSVGVGIAVFGWRAYEAWLVVLGRVDWMWAPMNASVHGLLARTLATGPVFIPLVHAPGLVVPATVFVSGTIAAAMLMALAKDGSGEATDRAFAALLLASLLISPLGWMYYLWLAAGPLAALWRTLNLSVVRARGILVVLALPGLLLPIYMTILWRNGRWGSITLGSAYAWTVMALWGAVMIGWQRERSPRA